MRRLLAAAAVSAGLGACSGWEGPPHWLDEAYTVGKPASVCRAGAAMAGDFPSGRAFKTDVAGWTGDVRAQTTACTVHTPLIGNAKAAWVECRVEGPARITHTPPIGGHSEFVAGAGAFDLRATRRGLSCRPEGPR